MKLVFFGLSISSSWGNGHATLWRECHIHLYPDGQAIHPLAELQAAGSGCINCDGSGGQALVPAEYVDEVTRPFWEAR